MRKAAELARSSEAGGGAPDGLTLEEMKAAAAEAGFDPVLVERAARLIPSVPAQSPLTRFLGGPLRLARTVTFPTRLDAEASARLLAGVRAHAGQAGTGESSALDMSWHSKSETTEILVNAHTEGHTTSVSTSVHRHSAGILTTIIASVGTFFSFLLAMVAEQETAISPYLVLAAGLGGSLALARALWASRARLIRGQLETLMGAIDNAFRRRGDTPREPSGPQPKANLADKLSQITEHWTPRLAARVNDTDVKLVKLQGDFAWHRHEGEDELFVVIQGRLLMQFRDREEWVEEGEMILVPRGVEHCPLAPEEVHVMLIEPAGTVNTGDAPSERTVEVVEPI